MLRMDVERVMRQRSLKPREGTDIYLMNVPRRYAGTPEGEKCWFSLQGRLERFLGSCCTGPGMQPRKVGMME